MGNTSSSHIYHIESAYQCRRDMPPQVENRSVCISASISPHSVYIVSYLKALWHICAESCMFEGEKIQVDMSVYCSPAMCGHVTTYHVIYMYNRYYGNMMPDFHIWCDMHTRWAIYKRYVEHGYSDNMDGSMSNMLRYVQYVRYVRYAARRAI